MTEGAMTTDLANYTIGFPLYPGFDSLDVLGPFQVFTFLGVKPLLLAATKTPVTSFENVAIQPHYTFAEVDNAPLKLNAFFVPGGSGDGVAGALNAGPLGQNPYLDFLVRQAPSVSLRISVCTGALLLGAAGLLRGYQATTHWAFHNLLARFPGVLLAAGYPRYVIDRNLITGGGISSGIDEALAVAAILAGPAAAQRVQLSIQYAPNPPYQAGDPSQAPPDVLYTTAQTMSSDNLTQAVAQFI